MIHFESFDAINEWCFVMPIKETTINFLYHKETKARTSLEHASLDYRYFPDWDYYANVLLKPGDGIFFRPWLFHSLERGMVHYFRMVD
jgi:hypothetical protein